MGGTPIPPANPCRGVGHAYRGGSIGGYAFGIVISPSSLSRRRRNRHSPPPLKGPVIAITDGAFFIPSDMRKTNAPRAGRDWGNDTCPTGNGHDRQDGTSQLERRTAYKRDPAGVGSAGSERRKGNQLCKCRNDIRSAVLTADNYSKHRRPWEDDGITWKSADNPESGPTEPRHAVRRLPPKRPRNQTQLPAL